MDFNSVLKVISDAGPYVAVGGTLLGGLAALFSSFLSFRSRAPRRLDPTATLEELVRADDVRDSLRQNDRVARWAGRANGFLIFGQVVVGGFLASAFVQQELDKKIVGALGVLVLLSSLTHQIARPDTKYRGARRRVVRLRVLLRDAEDAIFDIERKTSNAEPVDQVRRRISTKLSQLESSEVEELPGETRLSPPTPNPTEVRSSPSEPGASGEMPKAVHAE